MVTVEVVIVGLVTVTVEVVIVEVMTVELVTVGDDLEMDRWRVMTVGGGDSVGVMTVRGNLEMGGDDSVGW